MNLKEVKKIVWMDILIITFTIFCLVFSLIVILTDNVSAAEQVTNLTITNKSYFGCAGVASNTYCTQEYALTGGTKTTRNTNTTYNGTLSQIMFQFQQNMSSTIASQFTIDIYSMGNDFRNNDLGVTFYNSTQSDTLGNVGDYSYSFVSKSHIRVIVMPNSSIYHNIMIYGNPLTGISTYGIKKVTMTFDDGVVDNSDIINNQNQNTQDIINNNNTNTQDIINNINGALSEWALSEKVNNSTCYNNGSVILAPSLEGYYIADSNGGTNSNMNYNVSYNYGVYGGQQYTINFNNIDGLQYGRLCWYHDDTLISCPQYRNMSGYAATNFVVTAPDNANYISLTYRRNVVSSIKGKICVSDSVMEQSTQKNQLDYLQDDSDPTIDDNAVDGVLDDVEYNDPLNYLLVLPLHAIQRINTALSSSSCSRITFGRLYGSELYLPCIDIEDHIGSNLFNTIDVMMGIGLLAITLKKFYDTISNILTLGKEKEIKDKLDLPTPMEFLALIFGGGR